MFKLDISYFSMHVGYCKCSKKDDSDRKVKPCAFIIQISMHKAGCT